MNIISWIRPDVRFGFLRASRFRASVLALVSLMLLGVDFPMTHANAQSAREFSRTGRLTISLMLKGSGRHVLPNKVEWSRLDVERKLNVTFAMELSAINTAPVVEVGGTSNNHIRAPKGIQTIAEAMEACGEDEACQAKAMLAIGLQLKGDPASLGALKLDETRFANWTAKQGEDCAAGTISVSDEGAGVNIAPPSPAAPYRFHRAGKLSLPADAAIMEQVCRAIVTVDRQSGLASLRIPAGAIPVAVRLSGQAFTNETSVPFREGQKELELRDQKIEPGKKSWQGAGRIANAGSVSHNSGSTTAPVSAAVTWQFVQD